jgi:hypothetical protein
MNRLSPIGLFALALLFSTVDTPAAAQTKTAPVDERLFALYALEDMYNKPLPRARENVGFLREVAESAAFLAQRQILFDRLRRHCEKNKKFDDAILDRFRGYERELDIWKQFREKLTRAGDDYCRTLRIATMAAQQRSMNTALSYGLFAYLNGRSGNAALLTGWLKGIEAARKEQAKLNQLQQKALAKLSGDVRQAVTEFDGKIGPLNRTNLAAFDKAAAELCSQNGWSEAEFASKRNLSTTEKASTSTNPFLIVQRAIEVRNSKDASKEEMLEQARACLRAAEMVPAGKVYNAHRAMFLSVGGLLANSAAAKDLGTTGFISAVGRNAPKGGALALTIWQRYVKNEPLDGNITDTVIHHYILGCCYAGKPTLGYGVVLNNCANRHPFRKGVLVVRPIVSTRPQFWYDCARVSSIHGNAQFGLACLQHALNLGYRDREAAKIDPDLKAIRENRLTADQFRRLLP